MLNLTHIASVLSTEASRYGAGAFISTIVYVWIAYLITGSVKKIGFRIFWIIYGILQLYVVLKSNVILYNPFLYFATTVILLQLNFHQFIKKIISILKERARNKFNQCKARNMYYDSVEEKVRREEEIAREQDLKNRQQKNFLENLDKKFNTKFKF